jgi:NH3-dependent NAD+ synthetase
MDIKYSDLDSILYGMDQDLSDAQISSETGLPREEVEKIRRKVAQMEHKRLPAIRPSDF